MFPVIRGTERRIIFIGLKIVSLYDGISCGRVALERAGYTVSSYHAFEIDKHAIAVSRYQYPDIEHHGDVLDADFYKFADMGIDLVIGGSPCTFWSIAKANREIDKSGMGWKLFMRFVEAVRQIKPRYFLLENVASMPNNIKAYISEELGCEPVLINSALVSAQSRKRLYWTNIGGKLGVQQPADKGILLKDILESGLPYQDKSHCITASYDGAVFWNSIERKQRSMVAEPIVIKDKSQTLLAQFYKENANSLIKRKRHGLIVAEEVGNGKIPSVSEAIALADKSQTILSTMHKENALSMMKRQKTGLFVAHAVDEIGAAFRTREDENGRFKRLEVRHDGKMNALTTVQTDTVVCSPVRIGEIGKGGQGSRIYSVQGKTVSIMANGGGRGAKTGLYKIDLPDGDYAIRKLTPVEAERCQTLPDNYTAWGTDDKGNTVKISNTQRYRAIGNGFTADVIAHILTHINNGGFVNERIF